MGDYQSSLTSSNPRRRRRSREGSDINAGGNEETGLSSFCCFGGSIGQGIQQKILQCVGAKDKSNLVITAATSNGDEEIYINDDDGNKIYDNNYPTVGPPPLLPTADTATPDLLMNTTPWQPVQALVSKPEGGPPPPSRQENEANTICSSKHFGLRNRKETASSNNSNNSSNARTAKATKVRIEQQGDAKSVRTNGGIDKNEEDDRDDRDFVLEEAELRLARNRNEKKSSSHRAYPPCLLNSTRMAGTMDRLRHRRNRVSLVLVVYSWVVLCAGFTVVKERPASSSRQLSYPQQLHFQRRRQTETTEATTTTLFGLFTPQSRRIGPTSDVDLPPRLKKTTRALSLSPSLHVPYDEGGDERERKGISIQRVAIFLANRIGKSVLRNTANLLNNAKEEQARALLLEKVQARVEQAKKWEGKTKKTQDIHKAARQVKLREQEQARLAQAKKWEEKARKIREISKAAQKAKEDEQVDSSGTKLLNRWELTAEKTAKKKAIAEEKPSLLVAAPAQLGLEERKHQKMLNTKYFRLKKDGYSSTTTTEEEEEEERVPKTEIQLRPPTLFNRVVEAIADSIVALREFNQPKQRSLSNGKHQQSPDALFDMDITTISTGTLGLKKSENKHIDQSEAATVENLRSDTIVATTMSKRNPEVAARGLLTARLETETIKSAQQRHEIESKREVEIAAQKLHSSRLRVEREELLRRAKLEADQKAELVARGLLAARLQIDARDRVRRQAELESQKQKTEVASQPFLSSRQQREGREKMFGTTELEGKRNAEAAARSLLKARLQMEAQCRAQRAEFGLYKNSHAEGMELEAASTATLCNGYLRSLSNSKENESSNLIESQTERGKIGVAGHRITAVVDELALDTIDVDTSKTFDSLTEKGRKGKPVYHASAIRRNPTSHFYITKDLITIFTPERGVLQLLEEEDDDAHILGYGVSCLIHSFIDGGTAAISLLETDKAKVKGEETDQFETTVVAALKSTKGVVSALSAFTAFTLRQGQRFLNHFQ